MMVYMETMSRKVMVCGSRVTLLVLLLLIVSTVTDGASLAHQEDDDTLK